MDGEAKYSRIPNSTEQRDGSVSKPFQRGSRCTATPIGQVVDDTPEPHWRRHQYDMWPLKYYSCTLRVVALGSVEAEVYALNRSAAEALGVQSSAAEFGVEWRIGFHADASAAVGITQRRGAGKFKHTAVQEILLQGVVQDARVGRGTRLTSSRSM